MCNAFSLRRGRPPNTPGVDSAAAGWYRPRMIRRVLLPILGASLLFACKGTLPVVDAPPLTAEPDGGVPSGVDAGRAGRAGMAGRAASGGRGGVGGAADAAGGGGRESSAGAGGADAAGGGGVGEAGGAG